MTSDVVPWAPDATGLLVAVLCALIVASIFVAIAAARRARRALAIPALLILNVSVVQIASAVAHLVIGDQRGGYIDLTTSENASLLSPSIAIAACALAGTIAGVMTVKSPRIARRDAGELRFVPERSTLILLLALTPVALAAVVKMNNYAASQTYARVIVVDAGYAKFGYLSYWSVWCISAAAVAVLMTPVVRKSSAVSLIVVGCALVGMAYCLSWTGGRSILVLFAFPLIRWILPRMRRARWVSILIGLVVMYSYILALSRERQGTARESGFLSFLDWQWGRFSMNGFAVEHVQQQGFTYGSTLAASVFNTANGLFGLAGIGPKFPQWSTTTQFAGLEVGGSRDVFWMVPGFSAETYLALGYAGTFLAFFVGGRVSWWVESKIQKANGLASFLLYAFIGSLLIFRLPVADSGSPMAFLIFGGSPLIAAWVFAKWTSRARAADQSPGGALTREERCV